MNDGAHGINSLLAQVAIGFVVVADVTVVVVVVDFGKPTAALPLMGHNIADHNLVDMAHGINSLP